MKNKRILIYDTTSERRTPLRKMLSKMTDDWIDDNCCGQTVSDLRDAFKRLLTERETMLVSLNAVTTGYHDKMAQMFGHAANCDCSDCFCIRVAQKKVKEFLTI